MISLTRKEFITLAGLDLQMFRTLYRRNQIPFFALPSYRIPFKDTRQNTVYLPIDAVMMTMSDMMSSNGGIDRHISSAISLSPEIIVNNIDRADGSD